ncbi:uncharacterized protein LOC128552128 isoform X2 [Mercenaria mercenaria]|uniref:uncharacterized protein LOC128552128 isoform X2 n=1 Tax=Mercenaria mercenaria TaxID=6596 RepID=UPI00234FB447|nr:uncharacterized protein LOC128552128 isoform X2 [Mercenaria mercenaria]
MGGKLSGKYSSQDDRFAREWNAESSRRVERFTREWNAELSRRIERFTREWNAESSRRVERFTLEWNAELSRRQRLDQQFADNATNTDSMQSSIFTIPLRTRHVMIPEDASGSTPPRAQANPEYAAELSGLASEEDDSTHYYYYVYGDGSIERAETRAKASHSNDHYLTPVFTEHPRLSLTNGIITEQPEEQPYAHIRLPSCEQQIDQPAPLPPPCQKQPCNVSLQPDEHSEDDNDLPPYKRQTAVSSNISGCSPKTTAIYEGDCSDRANPKCDTSVEDADKLESGFSLTQIVIENTGTASREFEAQQCRKQEAGSLHRYEEMINLCRPMIVSNIIVSQVLPHLQTCLSQADISAIKSEQDRHKAVELLLDKLQASKEPGKWKMFVQALEECKYQTIVDALRRKGAADNNDHIKILHMFSPKLREMIVPSELTVDLLKVDVINSDDRSEIHQKERSAGAVAAADILLDRIPSKHPRWFDNFLEALRSVNRSDLADMLTG